MLTARQVARMNYGTGPYRPTPAQRRVLERFRVAGEVRQLPAHADYWQRHDRLPLQALIRRGYIRFFIGPYENHYLLTYRGQKLLNANSEPHDADWSGCATNRHC